jgi:hypothetical protein
VNVLVGEADVGRARSTLLLRKSAIAAVCLHLTSFLRRVVFVSGALLGASVARPTRKRFINALYARNACANSTLVS